MPIKLSVVLAEVRKSSVPVMVGDTEQTLDFTFKPNAYTPLLEKDVEQKRLSGEVGSYVVAMLSIVLDWVDLELPDGKACTTKVEDLSQVPFPILNDLLTKINEEMDPGKKKKPASGGSFSAMSA